MKALRPTSVSIVSWLLIIGSVIGMLALDYARQNGNAPTLALPGTLSPTEQIGVAYGLIVSHALFGILLLNGLNWGRILFVLIGATQHSYLLSTGPVRQWPILVGLILFLAIVIVLFRPQANAFFRGRPYPEDLRGLYWRGGH